MGSIGGGNPLRRGSFNTLAQTGTKGQGVKAVIIQGNGSDLGNSKGVQGRAKRKLITKTLMLSLIDTNQRSGSPEMKKGYWNTYHCQERVISSKGRIYTKYCKNRHCTLCSANRKADIINRYLPVLEKWPEPYFVTLTVRAVPYSRLRPVMKCMLEEFQAIIGTYKKRSQRGKGAALIGIKSLESNFNPSKRTYNPHFHIIVANREMAETLVKEWTKRSKPGWTNLKAQKFEKVADNLLALIEVVKYGSKIFTEPDVNNKAKVKGKEVLYAKALNNIFAAMKGLRIFDRFGFNLPKNQNSRPGARVITDFQEWRYDIEKFDWFNSKGEKLTEYAPGAGLLYLISDRVDCKLE